MQTDNTIFLMGRISEKANKFLIHEMAKIGLADLAPSHGDILANLFKYQETTMTQLAEIVHRDPSTVTTLVNKLKRRGLVQTRKDVADNRVTIVSLTEPGKGLEPDFRRISYAMYEIEYKGMSEEERVTLRRLLLKINENF